MANADFGSLVGKNVTLLGFDRSFENGVVVETPKVAMLGSIIASTVDSAGSIRVYVKDAKTGHCAMAFLDQLVFDPIP